MNKNFIGNAFSLQMIEFPANVTFTEVDAAEIPADCESAIGHADTAAVVSNLLGREVPMNRISVQLNDETTLYVAQVVGGRLPEGSTTLPENFTMKFIKVTLQ